MLSLTPRTRPATALPALNAAAPTATGAATAPAPLAPAVPATPPPPPVGGPPSRAAPPVDGPPPLLPDRRPIIRVLEYVEMPVCAARAGPREMPCASNAASATGTSL